MMAMHRRAAQACGAWHGAGVLLLFAVLALFVVVLPGRALALKSIVIEPDQDRVEVTTKPGVNRLLLKICQFDGQWDVYVAPELSPDLPAAVRQQVNRDFPPQQRKAKPMQLSATPDFTSKNSSKDPAISKSKSSPTTTVT